jgi:tetratricopeptide (TPR) repeat protein
MRGAAQELFAEAVRHHRAGRLDRAVACYRRVLALADLAEVHFNLGAALAAQGQADDAIACYRRAVARKPDYLAAHTNLGRALKDRGLLDDAVACYRRALDLKPDLPQAHYNLGNALKALGRSDAAIASYRRAIARDADYVDAHTNLSMALLAQGDMAAGWPEYEWRWRGPLLGERRDFAQPQWRGEPAAGRTLLIHAEQGFGDTLQFCRFVPLAAARGLRVVMEVQPALLRLLRDMPRADLVIARGAPLPPFDLHCPMMSLPLALGTTVATIPSATAYLHADAAQAASWRTRLDAVAHQGLRVGLVWAGKSYSHAPALAAVDRRRSLDPRLLAPVFDLPGAHFVSLQKDGPPPPAGTRPSDFMDEMRDFADTAALVANLDLVVAADTAVAHLAAALGRPVWLLSRFDSCWRWLEGRADSPWYPTLRLYRQPRPGDWPAVIAAVAADLSGMLTP